MRKKILLLIFILVVIVLAIFLIQQNQSKPDESNRGQKEASHFLPAGEELLDFLLADSNNDRQEEFHLLTKDQQKNLFHIYIISQTGEFLYSKKDMLIQPDSLLITNYSTDSYPSLFIGFEDQYQSGYFIHWDGLEYSIPDEEKGF